MLPIILTLAIALAGVVAVGGYFLTRGDAEVAQVALEPVSFAGSNPFTDPVGADVTGVKSPVGTGGEFAGDTPGLYGDTGGSPSCEAQTLNSALQSDPAKAAAWTEALGLTAADVPAYVASLSPVVLRADTAVTEHNFVNGTFSPYPAVLQSGTAVFVNAYGEPKVKCYNGNPLTRTLTAQQQVGYTGKPWPGFTPMQVTVVNRPVTVIKNYTVVNVRTGGQSSKPGNAQGPDDGQGFCDRNPGTEKCKPTTTNPTNPLGPSPGKGCTAGDKGWVCPVDFDPTKKPAPNCTQVGTMWSCPVTDPNTPPAGGCTKQTSPVLNLEAWRCPADVDLTKPPAAGCINGPATQGQWSCPFPPNPDTLVGGRCTKMVTGNAQGSTFSQSCPQPFDVDSPPAPECNSRGEEIGKMVWECPLAGLAARPPAPDCVASGAMWVCQQPFNAAKSPGAGCLAQNFTWVCPIPERKPPVPGCTEGDTGWTCPPALDPAKKPAPNCIESAGSWSCPIADPTKPPAANCTKTAEGAWACPPDPKTKPAENCMLTDTGWFCPPVPPAGKGGLTPDQVMQVCTVAQGGCANGKPTAEQQCAVLPMTCTEGKPNAPGAQPGAPAGGAAAGAPAGPVLTPEQAAEICTNPLGADPAECQNGKPDPAFQCAKLPATCTNGVPNAPAAGPDPALGAGAGEKAPDQAVQECRIIFGGQDPRCDNLEIPPDGEAAPAGMIVGPGMGEQANPCMLMAETCPPGTPGAPTDQGGAGVPPPGGGAGAPAVPEPCPAVPDPARPECQVAVDPAPAPVAPDPGTPPAGDAGAGGGAGTDQGGGGAGTDQGGGGGGADQGGGGDQGGNDGGG